MTPVFEQQSLLDRLFLGSGLASIGLMLGAVTTEEQFGWLTMGAVVAFTVCFTTYLIGLHEEEQK